VLGYVIRGETCGHQYLQIYYSIRAVPYNCPFCSLKLDWVQTAAWLLWRDESRLENTKYLAFEPAQNESGKNTKDFFF
jgi:hypothetical protein